VTISLLVPSIGLVEERRRGSRLMTPKMPRFWPEMKMRRGLSVS
jgi:hypothetical protein